MKRSDGQDAAFIEHGDTQSAILHDAYFNRPPSLIRLFAIRLIMSCALSVSAVWSLTDLFQFGEGQGLLIGTAAVVSALLFVLTSLLPSEAVYGTIFAGGGITCIILREKLIKSLSFYWDGLMLKLDSRLLKTQPFMILSYDRLKAGRYDQQLADAKLLITFLIVCLLAMLTVFCTRTRFRPIPVIFVFALLAAPSFAAEFGSFYISIAFFAAAFLAFCTVDNGFSLDSRLVFGRSRAAREATRRNEHSYRKRTRFSILENKLRSDLPRYFKYNANGLLAFAVCLGLILGAANIIPDGQGFDYEKVWGTVQRFGANVADTVGEALGVSFGTADDSGYFSYSSYGDNSGGIGISEPSQSNTPVLEVILDRGDIPVYLRGDIGVDYTGSSWTAIRDDYGKYFNHGVSFEQQLASFCTDTQYQVLRQRLSSMGYNPDRLFPLQKVSLSYLRNTKVVFQPFASYELNYKDSADYDCFGDYVLRTREGKGYTRGYETLSLTPNMTNPYMSEAITSARYSSELNWTLPGGMSADEYLSYITTYESFVETAYTRSDPVVSALVEELRALRYIDNSSGYVGSASVYDTANGICRYFKDNYRYSLTADNGEPSRSLESFLYRTREGHCALFASAMVLAMRELGVPARYVTGYVVYGSSEPTEDGRYRYTLRENSLHAWVEVYFKNAGWLPFDPTAAVNGFNSGQPAGDAPPEQTDMTPEQTTAVSTRESETDEEDIEPVTTTVPDDDVPMIEDDDSDTTSPPDGTGGYDPEAPVDPDLPPDPDSTADQYGTGSPERPPRPGGGSPSSETEKGPDLAAIFAAILPYLTVTAVLAAVTAAIALFIKGVSNAEQKALRGFRKKAPERAVAEMYRLTMRLLEMEGLSPGAETLTDYAVRIDNSPLVKGANVFMTDVMPVFAKREFGKPEISPITEEERLAVWKFTHTLYHRVMDKKNIFSKFFTKISLFL